MSSEACGGGVFKVRGNVTLGLDLNILCPNPAQYDMVLDFIYTRSSLEACLYAHSQGGVYTI